jgi:PAS domain S-box-containing protein
MNGSAHPTVSDESVHEELVRTLLTIAVAQAGAERGLLVLPRGDGQRIEAEATTAGDAVEVRLCHAVATPGQLPDSVLHHVIRTQDSVLLDDASAPSKFSADEYIRAKHARSILCLPLVKQATLIGVLYLENSLTPSTFTPARVAALKLLASQAATSLENAPLDTDLQDAEESVRRHERELRLAVDTIPALVWTALPDGSCDFLNQRWLDYAGLTHEEAKGWGWQAAVCPQDLHGLLAVWRAVLASGKPGETEARLRRFDGEYRWFLFRAVPLFDALGNLVKWYGTTTDIQDRKWAEALLAGEKRLLEMIARDTRLAPILDAVCRLVEEMSSGSLATVLLLDSDGSRLRHGAAPSLAASYTEAIDGSAIGPCAGSCGTAAYRREPVIVSDIATDPLWADYRHLALAHGLQACWSTPIFSSEGKVLGTFAIYSREPGSPTPQHRTIIEQITHLAAVTIEREHTETALKQSEERFRRMADTIPEVIWFTVLEPEKVLYVSPSFERIWGLPVADLYRNPRLWTETIHPEDRARVTATFTRWIAGEQVSYQDVEYRIIQPGGATRWIHERGVLVRNEEGQAYLASGISTDVTERKLTEDAVRAARARFEGILEIAQDAIISIDFDQRIVLFNQGAEKVFGYTQAEVIGRPLDLLLPQRFEEVHRKHIEEFAWSPDVARTMGQRREVSGRRKDGGEFPAEASISKLELGGEMVFTVILRDITDRKRAEQRLVAQHTVTQVLAEAATLEEATPRVLQAVCECLVWDLGELWRIDRAAGVLRCVEVWHKVSLEAPHFVATSHERTFRPGIGLPGRVWASREPAYIPDVVHDANFPRAPIAAREGLHAAFAFPILLGGDVVGVMAFFSQEIRHPDQDLLEMMATIGSQIGQFIERKRAEEELRRSEAYLAEAQRLSLTGSFGWNVSSGALIWSKETFCILGYDPGATPTLELVFQRVHPDDLGFVQRTVERASRERTDLDFTHRLLMPDTSVKHVHVMAHAFRDDTDALEFVGAVSDVTTAKAAEERIRQDERELRQIVEAIPALILVLTPDGDPLYANERLLEYTGLTLEDVQAGDFRERVLHPSDVQRVRDERQEGLACGIPFQLEQRARAKDGRYRWFLIHYRPLRDEQGHVIHWYATGTDIDERKRVEESAQRENLALREEIDKTSMFEEIVGVSPALQVVLSRVAKVAPTDSTVLITGETGTGKELVARAIHKRSLRAARAFVSVNCAAVPQALIASELFGHEKGAFTGAAQRRLGRFELADGGTLFLDEIGELPAETQIALLRVLQEREFERVGGTHPIRVDVRVIAAANRALQGAIASGTFRSDLFYRLNVFPIEMPPLRDRKEDLPLLVEYFVDRFARKMGKKIRSVSKRTLDLLQAYPWPGNIRELQNVIERSVIVCETGIFSVDESWLSREAPPPRPTNQTLSKRPVEQERDLIEAALAETRGRVSGPSGAAAKLGLPASTLESKIRSLKINKHRFKPV